MAPLDFILCQIVLHGELTFYSKLVKVDATSVEA